MPLHDARLGFEEMTQSDDFTNIGLQQHLGDPWLKAQARRMSGLSDFLIDGSLVLPNGLRYYPDNLVLHNVPELRSLGNLQEVGGFLDVKHCKSLEDLGDLRKVHGGFRCEGSPNLTSVGKLRSVGGWLNLTGTNVKSVPDDFHISHQGQNNPLIGVLANNFPLVR